VNRDGDEATVDVDLDSEDSDSTYVTLNMVKEDGEWRPCGGIFGFEPEDSTSVLDLDDNI
jgi:hypothetical protein